MKATDLFEMPQVLTHTMDWGLPDDEKNKRRTLMLLHTNPVAIREFVAGKLYKTNKEVFFVSNSSGLIDYYMTYETKQLPELGRCATQIKVWRRSGIGVKNITSIVFYDIMLGEFDTLVSDRMQSKDGQRFWIDRLAESLSDGKSIGLIDHNIIIHFDQSKSFPEWIQSVDGWGKSTDFQEKLFFISKMKTHSLK